MSDIDKETVMANKDKRYVVVTTEFCGVFGGYLESKNGDVGVLSECRNCIYWTEEVNGFGGLAVTGPLSGCRIGPPVPRIELRGITSILDCSEKAVQSWLNF